MATAGKQAARNKRRRAEQPTLTEPAAKHQKVKFCLVFREFYKYYGFLFLILVLMFGDAVFFFCLVLTKVYNRFTFSRLTYVFTKSSVMSEANDKIKVLLNFETI